jgi:hypothetical protein
LHDATTQTILGRTGPISRRAGRLVSLVILAQYPTEIAKNLAVYPGKLIEGTHGLGGVLGVAASRQRGAECACADGEGSGELAAETCSW